MEEIRLSWSFFRGLPPLEKTTRRSGRYVDTGLAVAERNRMYNALEDEGSPQGSSVLLL